MGAAGAYCTEPPRLQLKRAVAGADRLPNALAGRACGPLALLLFSSPQGAS